MPERLLVRSLLPSYRAVLADVWRAGALNEAFPGHAQEVRRLFTGCLTPEQLDQIAGIATTILDNLKADQPSLNANR